LAIGQIGQFGIRAGQATDMVQASVESEYAAAADKVLNKTGGQAFDAVRMLKSADPSKYQPENGAEYPRSAYGEALRQIAQLVKADVGLEVAFAEAGGWDTHVNQGASVGQLAQRLADFSQGIAALAVAENGNRGTDHGHGNAMFVIGGHNVRGGKVYGKWPGLAREQRYDGRDLGVT